METISISNVVNSESPERDNVIPINTISIGDVTNQPRSVSISEVQKTTQSSTVPLGIVTGKQR